MQSLMSRLAPGDVGCLPSGVYAGNLTITAGGRSGAPVTLTADAGATATICGYVEVKDSANYVTLQGLRIDGSCSTQNTIQIWGDFVTVANSDITNKRVGKSCVFIGHHTYGLAYNTVIDHNRIHDCSLGTWLDWQTQGTRVSRNLFYGNSRDLFIEVSHGPHLVEHNILASRVSLEVHSQGGAFVNNLLCGTISMDPIVERPTPYHVPHSTQVAGYAAITGGEDRYIGNVFLGSDPALAYGPESNRPGRREVGYGTAGYDGHPASMEDYLAQVSDRSFGVVRPHRLANASAAAAYARSTSSSRDSAAWA